MKNKRVTLETLVADERFQRFCLQAKAADIKYWENWLQDHPELEEVFQQAQTLVMDLHASVSDLDIDSEWDRLSAEIANQTKEQSPKKIISIQMLLRVAAILLPLLIALGVWNYSSSEPKMQTVQTEYGMVDSIFLSDQTKVVLNANSSIQFSQDWKNAPQREVWLQGEAWFEVTSNTERPFIVHTAKGDIRVLGTVFNAVQRGNSFDVVLQEGKIRLELEQEKTVDVQPGEQVIVRGTEIQKREVNLIPITAWRRGKLVFKNSSVQNIMNRLQEEYGWTIKVNNTDLLERKVNASVPRTKPELLLKALKEIYEFDIQQLEEKVYLIQ